MLVHAFNHLIPQSDGSPTVFSSATTSTYIPDIPYDDFTRPQHFQPDPPYPVSARRDRRMRTAPYPLSISTNAASLQPQQHCQENLPLRHIPLHSPRPIAYFNPVQAFDNATSSTNIHSPLAFTPGAHGTILGPFATQPEPTIIPGATYDELTATQMACMQASAAVSAHDAPSPSSTPSASSYARLNQSRNPGLSSTQIQMPRVPSIPQAPGVRLPPARPLDFAAPNRSNGAPHLPDAIPPNASVVNIHPTSAVPSNTFPTPVELLNDLSLRDAESAQKDHRRAEHRAAQQTHDDENLGYTPTDPDTISTHDKKRFYLDCLEQYVVYLHNQLRLVGIEPVPVERLSSGRGLTSRSIRTMIVHLKSTTAKLHAQKKDAEFKVNASVISSLPQLSIQNLNIHTNAQYDELRAQLGADADSMVPTLVSSNPFADISAGASNAYMQPIPTPTAAPNASSSSSTNINADKISTSSTTRRHSVAATGYSNPAPTAAQGVAADIGCAVQSAYTFP